MLFLSQEDELNIVPKIQSLYFYASWMPFHKKMVVMLDKMQDKHKDVEFIAIDTDQFKGLCKRFSIESIPTVLLLKDGVELKRITGLVLTKAFRTAFDDICNSES